MLSFLFVLRFHNVNARIFKNVLNNMQHQNKDMEDDRVTLILNINILHL